MRVIRFVLTTQIFGSISELLNQTGRLQTSRSDPTRCVQCQCTHRSGSIRFVLTQPVYTGHCDTDPVILVEYVNGPVDLGLLGLS